MAHCCSKTSAISESDARAYRAIPIPAPRASLSPSRWNGVRVGELRAWSPAGAAFWRFWRCCSSRSSAVAQVIPPSAQPGRERERFVEPQGPRAQPVGPTISLPSTVAPAGAESIMLSVSRIVITGATVYDEADFAPLYADLIGHEVPLAAIYDLARRITAKYGAAGYVLSRAVVPPQNFGRHGAVVRIQVVEGYVDNVVWPVEKLARYRDFFTDYTNRIVADRPANIRTLERYLLLANDLPGLKFATTLKPSPTHPNASTLIVEVTEKRIDAIARIDNRGTHARGPWQYLGSARSTTSSAAHEAFTVTWAGTFQLEELQYLRRQLPPGAYQRRPDRLRQCELRLRPARHRFAALARLPHPLDRDRGGPELSGACARARRT